VWNVLAREDMIDSRNKVMKTFALCLLFMGCAASQNPTPVPSAVEGPPPPFPDDIQVVSKPSNHSSHSETPAEEQARYEASIRHIEQEFAEEQRQLDECLSHQPQVACRVMRAHFCEFDTLCDTRAYCHVKPYCR
jgi:hypothetical protein